MATKKKAPKRARNTSAGLVVRESAKKPMAPDAAGDLDSVRALVSKIGDTRERLLKARAELLDSAQQAEQQRAATLERIADIDQQLELLGTPREESRVEGKSESSKPAASPKGAHPRPPRAGTQLDRLIRQFRRRASFIGSDVQEALDIDASAAFSLIYHGQNRGVVQRLGVEDGKVRWRVVG